jgi:hypothetical protein
VCRGSGGSTRSPRNDIESAQRTAGESAPRREPPRYTLAHNRAPNITGSAHPTRTYGHICARVALRTERRFCAPVDWSLLLRSVRLRGERGEPRTGILRAATWEASFPIATPEVPIWRGTYRRGSEVVGARYVFTPT